jgi:hypothetical protein
MIGAELLVRPVEVRTIAAVCEHAAGDAVMLLGVAGDLQQDPLIWIELLDFRYPQDLGGVVLSTA